MINRKREFIVGQKPNFSNKVDTYKSQNDYLSRAQFREYIFSLNWLRDFSRYSISSIEIYAINAFTFPLITKIILFWIGKKSYIVFSNGDRELVGLKSIIVEFLSFIVSLLKLKGEIKAVKKLIILHQKSQNYQLNLCFDNIVFLRTDLWYGLRSGGSVTHISGVINNLKDRAKKLIFLTTDSIPTVSTEIQSIILNTSLNFQNFSEVPSILSSEAFFKQSIEILNSKKFYPSLIYQRYSLNNFSGVMLSSLYKVPFILEYNGSEVWISKNWGSRLKYENISHEIEMLNLKRADMIVVVSEEMESELIDRGVDPKKILVNPNGVDQIKYSPDIDDDCIRENLGLSNKCVIGFIGTFGHWHGVENLVRAFSEILRESPELSGRIHLLLIGDGPKMQNVTKLVDENRILESVTLTGTVSQEDGPKYLAACDILVSPHEVNEDGTQFFGSPTKLFEYMSMGKGIVASNLNQIGRVLEHNRTAILVKPSDVVDLKNGILLLVKDEELRFRLGSAAREEVERSYTWRHHTDKILDKLERL